MSQQQQEDKLYSLDNEALEALKESKPWMTDARYFTKVKISMSAAMKMLTHALSGVDRGVEEGGKPVEVMGLIMGHLLPETPQVIVVSDVFPLPVEGAETRVLADDMEVLNYIVQLSETMERTRQERFMGWYHSHPFELASHSHCFMSSTDIATQLGWQRMEDRNGNPWLGIVVDPLRSLSQGKPELGAFRAFSPDYDNVANETPDGKTEPDTNKSIERWGSCWNRYHSLQIEYFMSNYSEKIMSIISKQYFWMNGLSKTPGVEMDGEQRFPERIDEVARKLSSMHEHSTSGIRSRLETSFRAGEGLQNAAEASSDLCSEYLRKRLSQASKQFLFSNQP